MRRLLALAATLVLLFSGTAEAIVIVSPTPGTTVKPGDLVTLRVALGPNEIATEVIVVSDGDPVTATFDGTHYVGQAKISREGVGPDLLVAFAVLQGGGASFADVAITIDPGELRTLSLNIPERMTFAGETAGTELRGLFEDGVVRDLSPVDTGTTYSTSDSQVVALHPLGIVQARANGTATITATNRGRTTDVRVTVSIEATDTNRIPSITPGAEQTVKSEEIVTLSATATDPDGDALEYVWEQLSGRVVTLHNPTSANPEFVAPRTSIAQELEFLVSARDARGATTLPVLVRVHVVPVTPVGLN